MMEWSIFYGLNWKILAEDCIGSFEVYGPLIGPFEVYGPSIGPFEVYEPLIGPYKIYNHYVYTCMLFYNVPTEKQYVILCTLL